jgi:hypothetical protein
MSETGDDMRAYTAYMKDIKKINAAKTFQTITERYETEILEVKTNEIEFTINGDVYRYSRSQAKIIQKGDKGKWETKVLTYLKNKYK